MVVSKAIRVSSTSHDGRLFPTEKMYKQEIMLPHFQNVFQIGNTVSPTTTSSKDVATLRCCFKPFWVAMRILGWFPISLTPTEVAVFMKTSGASKYSVLVFVLIGGCTAMVTLLRTSLVRTSSSSFNEQIFSYMCVLYCTCYWGVPIGHWLGARKVAGYINDWAQFEDRCRKLTGVPISFTIRRQVWFWTIAIPILAATQLCFEYVMLKTLELGETIYYIYINNMIMYHYALWYYVCMVMSQASAHLQDLLTKELRAHPNDQGVVPKYRSLWQELCCLTRATGDVLCYTYGSILISWFTILTFSIYGFVSECTLIDRVLKPIGLGVNACIVFAFLFILCNSGHFAADAVGGEFLAHIKQLKTNNAVIQRQLEKFQMAVSLDPAHISLGGFVTIDRGLLISLLATIVTYLVVLMQFKAEAESPTSGSTANNATLTTTVSP